MGFKQYAGSITLILQLTTDSGAVVRQSRISRLRSKSSPVDDAEWEDVLCSTLLTHQYENRQKPKSAEKLELTSLMAGDQLTLIVRRNISGITQRLGEITLQILDEDEASDRVELLDWVGVAVDRATSLEMKIGDLSMKCEDHDRTIQMLNQQLEDLIEAKKEHETLLLEKFRELLNAKKLKIRDQQRLLAGAKVNHQKGEIDLTSLSVGWQGTEGFLSRTDTSNQTVRISKASRPFESIKEKSQLCVTNESQIGK